MDRFDRYRMSATSFCLAARSLRAVHGMQSTFRARQVLAFAWGSFIPGAHTGMNALTARFYPTVARSTGLSGYMRSEGWARSAAHLLPARPSSARGWGSARFFR
ncbi:hypothetical protein WL94_18685 [Burkholderia cepacia]|uniref:hypothetical protein n=1 Tax=Burkholderia cepacia TaxID=292 RepID=UPI00076D045A|nr:hypothetical protein [Burkholderia cepacia]KWF87254.1 hypothetical protein WL94_18685 [Burkholderia cepacia]